MRWGLTKQKMRNKKEMEEIAVVLKRFGDEQSTLLDQFERLTFEVQLNQAILGRSLSEPGVAQSGFQEALFGQAPPLITRQVKQGHRCHRPASGFNKFFKKLIKPILGRKAKPTGEGKREVPNPKDPRFFKAFSRSLRI